MATLGSLRLDIGLKLAQLASDMGKGVAIVEGGVRRMESVGKRVGGLFRTLGIGLTVAGIGAATKSIIDYAAGLDDLRQKTGLSVEMLSTLDFAARQNGTSLDGVSQAIVKLNRNISEAAADARSQVARSFAAVGVEIFDAAGRLRDTGDIYLDVARKIAAIEEPADRTRRAQELLGKAGADQLPLLRALGLGYEDVAAAAREAGAVLGNEFAQDANRFNNTLGRIQARATSIGVAILDKVLDPLDRLLSKFEKGSRLGNLFARAGRNIGEVIKIVDIAFTIGATVVGAYIDLLGNLFRILKSIATFDFKGMMQNTLKLADDFRNRLSDAVTDVVETWRGAQKQMEQAAGRGGGDDGFDPDALGGQADAALRRAEKLADLSDELARMDQQIGADIAGIENEILERQGNRIEALLREFDDRTRELVVQLEARGRVGDVAKVEQLRGMIEQQARFNELLLESERIKDRLAVQEDRIRASVETGLVGEIEAQRQLTEARQASLVPLEEILAKMEAIALLSGAPEMLQVMEQFRREIEQIAEVSDGVAARIRGVFEIGLSDLLFDLARGVEGLRGVVESFLRSVVDGLARIAAEKLALQIVEFGVGLATGTPGLATGGIAKAGRLHRINEFNPEVLTVGSRHYLMMGSSDGRVQSGVRAGVPGPSAVRIINVRSMDDVRDYIGSVPGEEAIVNVIGRNAAAIRQVLLA